MRRIGIGKTFPSKPHKAAASVGQVGRACIGQELAQPGVAVAHHGHAARGLLDRAGERKQPRHTLQRMLFRRGDAIAGFVKRPRHLRVDIIRVSAAVGQKVHTVFHHHLHQRHRLRGVEFPHVLAVAPEAIGVRVRVEHIEAAGHDEVITHSFAHSPDGLAQKTGAVLKASAVFSPAGMARQQFTQQITVTAFDVHTVKADLPCQQRALYIPLRERVEVHVCDHNFPAFIQKRVMLRNQRTVRIICIYLRNFIHNIHSFNHFSKCRIGSV